MTNNNINVFYVKDKKIFPQYTGVYKIGFKNSESGRVYIGSASSIKKFQSNSGFRVRWNRHIQDLRKGKHHSIKLLRAYEKYGENNMFFEVLEKADVSNCLALEQHYINKFDNFNNGYNTQSPVKNDRDVNYYTFLKQKYIEKNFKTLEDLKMLYSSGVDISNISIKLGIHSCTCRYMLKFLGLYTPPYKTVYQYDLDGNFIKSWKNIKACRESLGVTSDTIRRVVIGDGIQALNFFFSYCEMSPAEVQNEYNRRLITSQDKRSKSAKLRATSDRMKLVSSKSDKQQKRITNIIQYDKFGNIVKIWNSSSEIEEQFGKNYKMGVLTCIRGKQKTCGGFMWKVDNVE
jgi:hypothetical protein